MNTHNEKQRGDENEQAIATDGGLRQVNVSDDREEECESQRVSDER